MNIQIYNQTLNYPLCNYSFAFNHSAFTKPKELSCDVFERTSGPSFTGKRADKAEMTKAEKKEVKKIEDTLKNIDGLHDPYSDVEMISQKRFNNFKNKLSRRSNAESMNALMANYEQHLFPSEAKILDMFREEVAVAKKNHTSSHLTYSDILKAHLPDAKVRLLAKEFDVTDSIREYSHKNLNKRDQHCVAHYLKIINDDISNDRFRIKSSRELLRNLYKEIPDKRKVDDIIRLSQNYPNTATDPDAFIVKYANRSHTEIAELLVSPSQISIEHIKPSSKRGESKGANYLAASKRMNNYRSSTPLNEVIERYPDIPRQTQRYIDELIVKINRGGLTSIAYTLPEVKESLYDQSKGKINVDISALRPEIAEQVSLYKARMDELVEYFSNQNLPKQ